MIYLQNFSTESGQGENVLLPGIIYVTDKNKVYYGNLKHENAVSMSINSNGEREFWDANGSPIVRDQEEITGNLIHFTLDGKEYTAIEGMTNLEWSSSKYNVDNIQSVGIWETVVEIRPGKVVYEPGAPNMLIVDGATYHVGA